MIDQKKLEQLWTCYKAGQFGPKTLEWHKKNTPGFAEYIKDK